MEFNDTIENKLKELEALKNQGVYPNIDRDTAEFLFDLVVKYKPHSILEVGSANGYSTIWLSLAAQSYNSSIITIEWSKDSVKDLQQNLNDCFIDNVTILNEDAKKVLRDWDTDIDFVFIDAMKREYKRYFQYIEKHLTTNSIVVADNIISHKNKLKDFIEYVTMNKMFDHEINNIGSGLILIKKLQ